MLKRSCSTSYNETRKGIQRKLSDILPDGLLTLNNQPNGKRNSYNHKEVKRNSSNALLTRKQHLDTLNVSIERSSGRRHSPMDHSNGDQGTRMDSPLLKSDIVINRSGTTSPKQQSDIQKEVTSDAEEKPKSSSIKDLVKNKSQRILQNKRISVKTQGKMRVKRRNIKKDAKDSPVISIESHVNKRVINKSKPRNVKLQTEVNKVLKSKAAVQNNPDTINLDVDEDSEYFNEETSSLQVGSFPPASTQIGKDILLI